MTQNGEYRNHRFDNARQKRFLFRVVRLFGSKEE